MIKADLEIRGQGCPATMDKVVLCLWMHHGHLEIPARDWLWFWIACCLPLSCENVCCFLNAVWGFQGFALYAWMMSGNQTWTISSWLFFLTGLLHLCSSDAVPIHPFQPGYAPLSLLAGSAAQTKLAARNTFLCANSVFSLTTGHCKMLLQCDTLKEHFSTYFVCGTVMVAVH